MSFDPYRVIVEKFPDGIVFLYEDRDGLRYIFVGGEGLEEIGLTKSDLEGHIVAEDRPEEVKSYLHSQYRRALDGQEVAFEIEAEGRHFDFQLRPVEDENGQVSSGFGVVQDITEEVVYRETLERQNERLEEFTQLVFHDIRNPLNVAQGRLALLEAEAESEYVEPIRRALETIESLTNEDSTPVSDVDRDRYESLELEPIIDAAWRNVATQSATLEIDLDRTVRGDPSDLRRLFENLFRNAVEHAGSVVAVRVGTLDDGLYVADDGPGIDPGQRDRVFDRGVSQSSGGSGLGLFIVQTVVDAHGWDIQVTESASGGARFEITGLPSTAEDAQ